MWMILSFVFHPILTFTVCYLWSIRSIACIQFTLEVEKDNSLSFLDVLFSKDIDWFSSTVFRKSFSSSLSNHPPQQKMAVFYTYVYHALHICSDASNPCNELNCLKSLALTQGYILSVINKALTKFKKPKHSVCHSDIFISFFVFII